MISILILSGLLISGLSFDQAIGSLADTLSKKAGQGKVLTIGAIYCSQNDSVSPLNELILGKIEEELTGKYNLRVVRLTDTKEVQKLEEFLSTSGTGGEVQVSSGGGKITPDWHLSGKIWESEGDNYLLQLWVTDVHTLQRVITKNFEVPKRMFPKNLSACVSKIKTPAELFIENVHKGGLKIALSSERANFKAGEDTVYLKVKANRDCYILVYDLYRDLGELYQIYPNSYSSQMKIPAGEEVTIPSQNDTFKIVAMAPPGWDIIKVFACEKPLHVPKEKLEDLGGYYKYKGSVRELLRDVRKSCDKGGYAEDCVFIRIKY